VNILVLRPGLRDLEYACFSLGGPAAAPRGRMEDYRGTAADAVAVQAALERVRQALGGRRPDVVAVHAAVTGGDRAGRVFDETVRKELEALTSRSPLRIPVLVAALDACQKVFEGSEIIVASESAFFAHLPEREQRYGLDEKLSAQLGLKRCGFHGLFHEAACRAAAAERAWPVGAPARILSVCLEPKPEVAAVLGTRPVMVSGGQTPLEGLPGETTCGELDPGVLLILSQDMKWGPEQINRELSNESGLSGAAGQPVSLQAVFQSEDKGHVLARDMFQYRLLQACGAGMAALSGLDVVVFSGRYAALADKIGPWLVSRPVFDHPPFVAGVPWRRYDRSLERIVADLAAATAAEAERV